ncbi:MAG: integral membrane sensor signal transduction histidine kinase [Bacteroidetes bacterium]|nr:MAG: integral membrane sensor signal transduction histidine kinase [Bacteroidota bacterium]
MNQKQVYFRNKLTAGLMAGYGKNGGSNSSDFINVESEGRKKREKDENQRMEELEEINSGLELMLEKRNRELAEIVETNTRFISIIAHDLRGPFCSIIGVLELLKDGLNQFDNRETQRYVDMASNSANRTMTLLDNLLAWTVKQNKEKSFNPVKTNLSEVVDEEIETVNYIAGKKEITIFNAIDPGLLVVADIQMVKTILRNLIGNAIKFTEPGGEVTISASKKQKFIEIQVEDNGIGIPHEDQEKLFNSGMLFSTVGTGKEQGTGLGLLLCKEFTELHGGHIVIDSATGKGCRIKFTLPHYL